MNSLPFAKAILRTVIDQIWRKYLRNNWFDGQAMTESGISASCRLDWRIMSTIIIIIVLALWHKCQVHCSTVHNRWTEKWITYVWYSY